MLSDTSKQGIALAFGRAARTGMVRNAGDSFDIVPIDASQRNENTSERVLVITASSFTFRLMTLFHVAVTPESRAYYGGEDASDGGLNEAFSEVVNLCGGAFNRELSQHVPHLGMSIPYILSAECLKHLELLKPQYLASFSITINQAVQFQVTLCMVCSAPVQIPVVTTIAEEQTGELELF